MGYRSQVAYTIRFVSDDDTMNKQSFFTFIAEAKSKPECAQAFGADDALVVDESKFTINFYADDVKWYDGYPDVDCHNNLISLASEWVDGGNIALGYSFVRIGEDASDITERNGGQFDWDWINVSRQIVCDFL